MGEGDARRSVWRRIVGDGSHLGFWTLPVFVATALGGAVIAGALAQVYYAQQVAQLEEETAAARAAAEVAAEDIDTARQDALDAIAEQLDGVRDALEVARPLEDPAAAGVVALTVELTSAPSSPTPTASTDTGASDTAASDTEDGADAAPPAPAAAPTRRAVGFAVAVEGDETFVATSFAAVADPRAPDGVARAVTVRAAAGEARGVVHAWDEARGVAVVRVPLVDVPVMPWRPVASPVGQGDVIVLAAVTPDLGGVQLPGRVGAVTDTAVVSDLPVDPVYDGAPLVDADGRVVAVQSSAARPFGPGSTGAVRAGQLCVELVSGCELLEQPNE